MCRRRMAAFRIIVTGNLESKLRDLSEFRRIKLSCCEFEDWLRSIQLLGTLMCRTCRLLIKLGREDNMWTCHTRCSAISNIRYRFLLRYCYVTMPILPAEIFALSYLKATLPRHILRVLLTEPPHYCRSRTVAEIHETCVIKGKCNWGRWVRKY